MKWKQDFNTELYLPGHPLEGQEASVDQLRECGQLFHRRGWSVGTSSNYSVVLSQSPIDLIVTASGKDKGRLERQDFVRVGADGAPQQINGPTGHHVVVEGVLAGS